MNISDKILIEGKSVRDALLEARYSSLSDFSYYECIKCGNVSLWKRGRFPLQMNKDRCFYCGGSLFWYY